MQGEDPINPRDVGFICPVVYLGVYWGRPGSTLRGKGIGRYGLQVFLQYEPRMWMADALCLTLSVEPQIFIA